MRIDHIAYRTKDRAKTARFLIDALGYHIQQEFTIDFDDGSKVKCIALEPPEKNKEHKSPWTCGHQITWQTYHPDRQEVFQTYHMPPEIFVSDGPPGSIVGDWVAARNGIGGIHHIAYQVDSVADKMAEWKAKGYAEFSTDEPIKCPGLTQVFTKPSELTGVIYEFIERGEHGFCAENVKNLMIATSENK
jgi:catechol 2,3-dioxygenase-like lactoylglutathione lyase family enzyme